MRTDRHVIAVVSLMLAACGGGDQPASEPAQAPEGSAAGATEAETAARSACDLLTREEIEAIAGEPIDVRSIETGQTESKCEYWGTVQQVPYLGLTAYWTGGQEQWDIQASGYAAAAELFRAAEGVELDSIVQPGPVPGLGDAAIYADLVPSVVLEGDVLLELFVFYLPDSELHFRRLVETALSRL